MGYFDRVTVLFHILFAGNQETEGSQDQLTGEQQSLSGSDKKLRNRLQQIYKDPIGLINRAKRQVQTFFKLRL